MPIRIFPNPDLVVKRQTIIFWLAADPSQPQERFPRREIADELAIAAEGHVASVGLPARELNMGQDDLGIYWFRAWLPDLSAEAERRSAQRSLIICPIGMQTDRLRMIFLYLRFQN
jgi:hypothetical protein